MRTNYLFAYVAAVQEPDQHTSCMIMVEMIQGYSSVHHTIALLSSQRLSPYRSWKASHDPYGHSRRGSSACRRGHVEDDVRVPARRLVYAVDVVVAEDSPRKRSHCVSHAVEQRYSSSSLVVRARGLWAADRLHVVEGLAGCCVECGVLRQVGNVEAMIMVFVPPP